MFSEEGSCSDCKIELIEKKWTEILLKWFNRCVDPLVKAKELNFYSLVEIINKYKNDICVDDIDRAILCQDDLEPFIKYKYPILRLRYLSENKDIVKKLYIMTTVLLFHCCCNSRNGLVDADICSKLDEIEQELILKFCERLSEMEVTINNVDSAIKDAFEAVTNIKALPPSQPVKNPDCDSLADSIVSDSPTNLPYPESAITNISSIQMSNIKFKSSLTVLPSAVTDTSTYSETSDHGYAKYSDGIKKEQFDHEDMYQIGHSDMENDRFDNKPRCQPGCACSRCNPSEACCGDPGRSMEYCDRPKTLGAMLMQYSFNWWMYVVIVGFVMLFILIIVLATASCQQNEHPNIMDVDIESFVAEVRIFKPNSWQCTNSLCQKVYQPINVEDIFLSHSRCVLICMGPQLWPLPIGITSFSKNITALATSKLEYKFKTVPSDTVHQYLAEAFKLFIADLVKLERIGRNKNATNDLTVNKMNIQIDVESDPDPRLRLDTEEAYSIKIGTVQNQVKIKISSASFCGVRHGLETLSQLILLDQTTGYLITLTDAIIKDAPSYKYRGLMIDTGRNYIPINDLMRTVDGMASCKLNTFHWRISDVTSFPLYLPKVPQLFEYGGYDRSKVYTKDDVKALVKRAGVKGIRVLIEVAAPGPVGRPWSWSSEVSCPVRSDNYTCENYLCLRMAIKDSIFDILEIIYSEIINMTNVDDIFHLSDGLFSINSCYNLVEQRMGFLDKALDRLKLANKGFLPKLPIVWYTDHLTKQSEAKTWERYGVQLNEWQSNPSDKYLSKFKVIHSSKWDLSCEMKKQRCWRYRTWQEMYGWKSWRNIEVFTIEGGETLLWTDLVDSGNLDYHLWPRAAAVAERLWSDIVINASATGNVYVRLDHQRWRMLLHGVKVQPIWPVWCSFNPGTCLLKLA